MLNNLDKKITDLSSWFDNNGFTGWDPYDVKGSDVGMFDEIGSIYVSDIVEVL